ncbi:hypothetical protein Csa_011457 [Cucumis sativus]|nr:hypothetical protein Csa_011457 [Cucumis sativus]
MPMLVNCSGCRTPLQLQPGAPTIRCAICKAVTQVRNPRAVPLPSHSQAALPPVPSPYYTLRHQELQLTRMAVKGLYSIHQLRGCLNDAKSMRYLLVNKFHFPKDSILMLTEEETDPYRIPNKHNIRMALFWLVQGCQPGDSLVFHFSGHGSRQRNYDGDEVDGYDETLCPLDFETWNDR